MCDRSHLQPLKCADVYGQEYFELWCPGCVAEYFAWLEGQAEEARALDRQCGLGWLWEQVSAVQPN